MFMEDQFSGFLKNISGITMKHSLIFIHSSKFIKLHPNYIAVKYWQSKEIGPYELK